MTLATHALVGAAVASLFPNEPALGISAAFASHFLIDAIPHWDYPIRSSSIDPKIGAAMRIDRDLLLDLFSIGLDALIGIVVALVFFGPFGHPLIVLLGALAGILPDPLQFVYSRLKREPLISLQRFHQWIHTPYRLKAYRILASISQIAFDVLVIVGTLRLLH